MKSDPGGVRKRGDLGTGFTELNNWKQWFPNLAGVLMKDEFMGGP